ncbi:related to choline dehydrogenase and related flavoproteins [Ramularia collo-cygni]|uniref:Related to choline dehydrogenase and related flavoproteins n=1 Tax=Ramularia collo-cygni TaxID=112498 RepID=A0A2D3UNK3_9PEZI|nr:related to choline dehydrogenase and related flavoproteins [Ramularia collo-cygni]CZT17672.1 related to choline dehydrogenase and related flavoproteins [Ramularia collo-cygni]
MISLPLFSLVLPLASAFNFGSIAYSNHFGLLGTNASFDYVVVGSGPGGMTMAVRLAEANNSVALVEAGGFYENEGGNRTLVPGYYGENLGNVGTNWNFMTKVQPQLYNQTVRYDRGRTLGGTSALNAMLYQRGTKGTHAAWARAVNDIAYDWDAFLPYFQKSANFTPPDMSIRAANGSVPAPGPDAYSAEGGPLHVTHTKWASPFSSWGQLALREMGLADIQDFDSGDLIGAQYCPLTVNPDDSTRASSEATFLRSYLNTARSHLQVYPHTLAQKVLFNHEKTATGVQVESYGQTYYLHAAKEVIVSAGAFQSPQLLMVSGIGPESELAEHNITTVSNLPGVGKNMEDHILIGVNYLVDITTSAVLQNNTIAQVYENMYRENGSGLLANTGADYLGWEKLPEKYRANMSATTLEALDKYPTDWPDFEFVVGSFPNTQVLDPTLNYAFILTALITPQSKGTISLNSTDMSVAPIIDVGWLTNPIDVEMAMAAVRRGREFWATDAIQPIVLGEEAHPTKNTTTDAELEEYVRKGVTTVYHASCTCAMGTSDNPMAVVDSKARVFGVKGLRVVDASSFPFLPPGHPQSSVYALGEKIADDVIQGR